MNLTTPPRLGAFGEYGGRYASELLHAPLAELARAVDTIVPSADFQSEFARELADYAGRPTPMTIAPRYSELCGLRVLLKREDLLHGGAHKTNNAIGQGLLARRLGKQRLVCETGAGQHGVATAMIGARLGLETVVYMGAVDVERQAANVARMELFGATVVPVEDGSATLKDAINEALRDWTRRAADTHYLLGTVCGPDPFPRLVRALHEVIGREAHSQARTLLGADPDAAVACVGGGSNALGLFAPLLATEVRLFGVEPAGRGLETGHHGAVLGRGTPGILHGMRSVVLQDRDGQILESESVAAGLDYPSVGPEHAALRDSGRVTYCAATDDEALDAFEALARLEGILPAFESSHALAFCRHAVARGLLPRDARVIVNVSGRGDKDLASWNRLRGGAA